MGTRAVPASARRRAARLVPSVEPRSATPSSSKPAKSSRLRTRTRQPRKGNGGFDPETFLARAGLGKKILRLKKGEVAYAQGDPADALFYVQKGHLRVTVPSAKGKEATISLVGTREFLGENCMISV